MKSPLLDLHLSKGLGDSICATPSLRKLYYAYGKKISVLTDHPYINLRISSCPFNSFCLFSSDR